MGREIQALEYQSVNIVCTAATYKYTAFIDTAIIPDEIVFSVQSAYIDVASSYKITTDLINGKQIGCILGNLNNVFSVRYIFNKSVSGTYTFWVSPVGAATLTGGELLCINMQFIKYK